MMPRSDRYGDADVKYTQTIIMTLLGFGVTAFWLLTDKAVMAHHMPAGDTLARAAIMFVVVSGAGLYRDRRAFQRKQADKATS